jgi:hypothetical protein
MIVNKALITAAVLLFTAPVVPALAHDDYGGQIRCLGIGVCPGNWHDHDGWRDHSRWSDHDGWSDQYRWRDHYGWRRYYGGWRYGGWRYGGWRYNGWGY